MQQFTSRDITFKENIFPFQPNSTATYMKPLPTTMTQMSSPCVDDDFYIPSDITPQITPPSSPQSNPTSASPHTTISPQSIHKPNSSTLNLRRSTRNHSPPLWHQDFITNNVCNAAVNTANTEVQAEFHCFLST